MHLKYLKQCLALSKYTISIVIIDHNSGRSIMIQVKGSMVEEKNKIKNKQGGRFVCLIMVSYEWKGMINLSVVETHTYTQAHSELAPCSSLQYDGGDR